MFVGVRQDVTSLVTTSRMNKTMKKQCIMGNSPMHCGICGGGCPEEVSTVDFRGCRISSAAPRKPGFATG